MGSLQGALAHWAKHLINIMHPCLINSKNFGETLKWRQKQLLQQVDQVAYTEELPQWATRQATAPELPSDSDSEAFTSRLLQGAKKEVTASEPPPPNFEHDVLAPPPGFDDVVALPPSFKDDLVALPLGLGHDFLHYTSRTANCA